MKTNRYQIICKILAGITLLLACSPCYGFTVDCFDYKVIDQTAKTVELSKFNDKDRKELSIPETVTYNENEYTVVSIACQTFFGTDITKITIPASVTTIGGGAFSHCLSLSSIIFDPDNAHFCFENGMLMSKDKTILYAYPQAVNKVEIPDGILKIMAYTFQDYEDIWHVTIPSSVLEIGYAAFFNCLNLTELYCYAPNPPKLNEYGTFDRNDNLKIYVPAKYLDLYKSKWIYNYSNIFPLYNTEEPDPNVFFQDYIYYRILEENPNTVEIVDFYFDPYLGSTILNIPEKITFEGMEYEIGEIGEKAFYATPLQSITLPSSVKSFKPGAFSCCRKLTTINIPTSITMFPDSLFAGCNKLETIPIPPNIVSIGNNAFADTGIKSITIPPTVKSIGSGVFADCGSLTNIDLPSTMAIIPDCLFKGCNSLQTIQFPQNIVSIGNNTFENCTSLKSIEIPNGVKQIGSGAFKSCSSLLNIKLPDGIKTIPESAFALCNQLESIQFPSGLTEINAKAFMGSGLIKADLPETVIMLGDSVFNNSRKLESINIPEYMDSLGTGAFNGCVSLSSIDIDPDNISFCYEDGALMSKDKSLLYAIPQAGTRVFIPEGVVRIMDNTFAGYNNIEFVSIPKTVTHIGKYGFYECTNLNEMLCYPVNPPTKGYHAFYKDPYNVLVIDKIYVPAESLELYYSDWVLWEILYRHLYPLDEYNGVEEIVDSSQSESAGPFTVYSLDGRFLMKARNADELQSLAKGIYIINGKKKFVK